MTIGDREDDRRSTTGGWQPVNGILIWKTIAFVHRATHTSRSACDYLRCEAERQVSFSIMRRRQPTG